MKQLFGYPDLIFFVLCFRSGRLFIECNYNWENHLLIGIIEDYHVETFHPGFGKFVWLFRFANGDFSDGYSSQRVWCFSRLLRQSQVQFLSKDG